MMIRSAFASAIIVLALSTTAGEPVAGASAPNAVRRMLIQHDLPIPG
jgi:hypothetical protein